MPADSKREVGRRIATIRHARRMTQTDLARTAYLSLAMIKSIERGARSPSDDSLESIAAALGVDPGRLITGDTIALSRIRTAIPAISASIAGYDIPMGPPRRTLAELHAAADEAVNWRLAAQYTRIAKHAPTLLDDALRSLHHTTGPDQQHAARLLVGIARAADAVAYKYGHHDLSARLIELMRWAARHSEDPLVEASTAYVRTETFFAARAHGPGLLALEQAIDASPSPSSPEEHAVRGALHMRAAVIAGRGQDADAADTHLAEARRLGDAVPEDEYQGTAFGPDSVRIHEVSVAVSLGSDQVGRALDVAREWTPPGDLPAERQSSFWIELARAQLWAGLPDDAWESLQVARLVAPQHTRGHPWARETAATLRRLRRSDAEDLTAFAEWIGAV
ncbi:helix-turn-helix domain-containing protein [Streptomyces sp. AN091965]|uniref:helix-turn-helix domain-containing protein n=1 Tax=Streptomyces sp. AN091965 TaxID=2927803 RepID=UPI001F606738|nr:helix-turn-helix transcriptional regulator [Streptomyces sp. AN091965]MCI3929971.1 helix-turn-helix domain-containing protein [Streptomyces sp. AN091965]